VESADTLSSRPVPGARRVNYLAFQALPRVRGAAPGYFRRECGDGAGR